MRDARDMEKLAADVAAMSPDERRDYERRLFWHRVGLDLETPPSPWRPISEAKKDGTLYLLLVDYSEETNAADVENVEAEGYLWSPNPIEDANLARTIGHNSDDNVGEDEGQGWEFAGWCWSHDHYTGGRGTPVAFMDLDELAPLPAEAAAS